MTGSVIGAGGNTSTFLGSNLTNRYGPVAARSRVFYQAVQQTTSEPKDDRVGEIAVSNSSPLDQPDSFPAIPPGGSLFPPSVAGPTVDLTANFTGRGDLQANLTVVPSARSPRAARQKKVQQPRVKHTSHIAQYRIGGEMFYVEIKGRRTYLRHPRWSLMGAGKSLADAEVALLVEAGLVVRVFGRMPIAELDEEAEKMLNFARRIA